MSVHDELMGDASAVLIQHHGRSVTYTPAGGSPVVIQGIFSSRSSDYVDAADGTPIDELAKLTILNSASEGVEAPGLDDTVAVDGVTWAVRRIEERTATMHRLELRRVTFREKSGPEHRMRR